MKKQDIIKLITAVIIVLVFVSLLYRYLVPPAKDNGIKVEVPHPVQPSFNSSQLDTLKNNVKDYTPDITPTDSTPKKIIE